jgi:hypothetical protein
VHTPDVLLAVRSQPARSAHVCRRTADTRPGRGACQLCAGVASGAGGSGGGAADRPGCLLCGATWQAARRLPTGAPGGLPTRRRIPSCPT